MNIERMLRKAAIPSIALLAACANEPVLPSRTAADARKVPDAPMYSLPRPCKELVNTQMIEASSGWQITTTCRESPNTYVLHTRTYRGWNTAYLTLPDSTR